MNFLHVCVQEGRIIPLQKLKIKISGKQLSIIPHFFSHVLIIAALMDLISLHFVVTVYP